MSLAFCFHVLFMPVYGWPREQLKGRPRTEFRSQLRRVGSHRTEERPAHDAAANDGFNLRAGPMWFRGRLVFIEPL